ncbi:MAG: glycosyltransferase family 2 protein [Candidatus Altiarchaeota archaeon]|nr:glycosyltransferase family 2 protein [Candidatus Altiarchaeota archaeon]
MAKKKGVELKFDLILLVDKNRPELLDASVKSCISQSYSDWVLTLVFPKESGKKITDSIESWKSTDERIRSKAIEEGRCLGETLNALLAKQPRTYVGMLDVGGMLHKHCLREIQKHILLRPSADVVYTDLEEVNPKTRRRIRRIRKPEYSPENLLVSNYIGRFTVIRASKALRSGGFRVGVDAAHEHDLLLRLSEKNAKFSNISCALYRVFKNKEVDEKMNSERVSATKSVIEAALARRGINAGVAFDRTNKVFRIRYRFDTQPLVSIIIPFKDKTSVLKTCIKSIHEKTSYKNYEIVLVDNGSTEAAMPKYLKTLTKNKRIHIIKYNKPFNYAAINNYAAKKAKGKILLFLNNDIKVLVKDWIQEMLGLAMQKHVGVVGAKLVFPSGKIQHTGTYFMKGISDDLHFRQINYNKGPRYDDRGKRLYDSIRNTIAVTGACMMIRREVYEDVGGMDEGFRVFFNDTDLCLRAWSKGYTVVYTPYNRIVHFEATSRGRHYDAQIFKEFKRMNKKWGKQLKQDPFYSPKVPMLWGDWANV